MAFADVLQQIADGKAKPVWLLELDALDTAPPGGESAAPGDGGLGEYGFSEDDAGFAGGLEAIYFSSHGFTSGAADTPASTHYDGRIATVNIRRQIIDRHNGIGGLSRVLAEVVLVNADGGLDTLAQDFALDGRRARILLGRDGDARASFGVVFDGFLITAPEITLQELRVSLTDGGARLDVPVTRTTYLGTGGLEGGADPKGKPKPKCWGHVFNISPPLVDSAKLIYQVHDGSVSDVPNLWDRQISITKGSDYASQVECETTAPSAGQYRVWKGGGLVRLGSTPAGTVTCDVLGDDAGGYVDSTADIVERILTTAAAFGAADIDAGAFDQLNVDAPAEVGIWIGTELRSIGSVVDQLLAGVGAFGGFSRLGPFTAAVIAAAPLELSSVSSHYEAHLWKEGATPIGYSLNADINGESQFLERAGPFGIQEIVNVCQSLDTPAGDPGADGGWQMNTNMPVNKDKSHLFTCWFKRLSTGTITGASAYWGVWTDSATPHVLNLNDTLNNNPYFANGALATVMPTADKWYLFVGFLHQTGYTGSDLGISGVYDPATGTRILDGNEFKFISDTTGARHRAYHYYNQTISGEVQQMARPRVFECSSSEASFMIAAILKDSLIAPLTQDDILNLEREPLLPSVDPIIWRARVAWQHNYTVQGDVAAGVTAARRTFAAEQDRLATREEPTTLGRRVLAREYGPTENLYALEADADTEALRLMATWGVARGLYAITLPATALSRDLNSTFKVTHPRHGFAAGRTVRVIGHEFIDTRVTLRVIA